MKTYSRINEDYLDNTVIDQETVSVLGDARREIEEWIDGGPAPSFDVQRLSDGFYKLRPNDDIGKIINLSMKEYGNECSLNWIDVSCMKNLAWLFSRSKFNGDLSRWDVLNVNNMNCMFHQSAFNRDISSWDVSNVTTMV